MFTKCIYYLAAVSFAVGALVSGPHRTQAPRSPKWVAFVADPKEPARSGGRDGARGF